MNNVSIIITIDSSFELVNNFFEHLRKDQFAQDSEIIVVLDGTENAKILGYVRQLTHHFKRIKIIQNEIKLGYGCSNNIGVENADGEYLFFINTDVFPEKNCFETLLYQLKMGHADCVQPLLLFPQNNRIQCAGTIFGLYYKKHLFAGRKYSSINLSSFPSERQALTSALYAIKKTDFNIYGKFDEFYYNKNESMELSLKMSISGKKCILVPNAIAFHAQGMTRRKYYFDFTQQEAYFWSNIGRTVNPDVESFYKMQISEDMLQSTFILISICQTRGVPNIVSNTHLKFSDYIEINGVNQNSINLFDILPNSIHNTSMPLLFFVENITNLLKNTYWFCQRHENDVAMDTNGNLLYIKDI